MAVVIWSNSPTYGDLKPFGVKAAAASVAVVKSGSVINVLFKFSGNGTAWPNDANAVQVGTLTTLKPIELIVLSSTVLELFDGASVLFRSKKAGKAGSWVAP